MSLLESSLIALALALGAAIGYYAGRREAALLAALLGGEAHRQDQERERLATERARLDRERGGMRDLFLARDAREATDLARERQRQDNPPEPAEPPAPWKSDPRMAGFRGVERQAGGRRFLQLRTGGAGNERIIKTLPLDHNGAIPQSSITPTTPAQ